MCAAKSPISALQELVVVKHLPLPQYHIIPQGSGFKCTGIIGSLSISTVAESKKRAKHLCAEHILVELQAQRMPSNSNNLTEIHSVHAPIIQKPILHVEHIYGSNQKLPVINAVGKLNEFCSQNGIPYPDYEEAGIKDQKFVIICKLGTHITQGHSSTKKHAKQIAAGEMLSRVSLRGLTSAIKKFSDLEQPKLKQIHAEAEKEVTPLWKKWLANQPADGQTVADVLLNLDSKDLNIDEKKAATIKHEDEVQVKIMELFKHLSYKNQKEALKVQANPLAQTRDNTFPNHGATKLNEDNGKTIQKIQKEENFSKEQLQEELKQLNISYKISEFQKRPLVLTMQTVPTRNHPRYTFMHSADSYPLAVLGLLQKAVHDIKILKR